MQQVVNHNMKPVILRDMLHPMSAKVIATILLMLALLVTVSAVYYMKSQYDLASLQQRIADLARKGSQARKQPIVPVATTPRPKTEIAQKSPFPGILSSSD